MVPLNSLGRSMKSFVGVQAPRSVSVDLLPGEVHTPLGELNGSDVLLGAHFGFTKDSAGTFNV